MTFGYDFSKPVAECEKVLRELRCLLDTGRMPADMNLSGRMGLGLASEAGKPAVWVAGHGPRMLRLTDEYGQKATTVDEWATKSGRTCPSKSLLPFVMLGQSKEYIADLMEKDPLRKLFALFCPGDVWAKRGYKHPFGDDCQGFIDLIVHDLDPQELRALVPEMPVELVEDVVFLGNADDVGERLSGYAANGTNHVVLCNLAGVVGGMEEIEANMGQFIQLKGMLDAM